MEREIDRKCLNHARVHANAHSFDRCESTAHFFDWLTFSKISQLKLLPLRATREFSRVKCRGINKTPFLFCEHRVPHDSLLFGNNSGFRSKGSAFNKFYEHWERWYVIRKPMWWWYLCFGYETELMIRLNYRRKVIQAYSCGCIYFIFLRTCISSDNPTSCLPLEIQW